MKASAACRMPVLTLIVSFLTTAFFVMAPVPGAAVATPAKAGDLHIEITGARSDQGAILASMFCKEDGFPEKAENSCWKAQEKLKDGKAHFVYRNLAGGTYAIAVMHDENGNNKMDTRLFGIPKEGYGFSQNPKLRFGPPSFKNASFLHDGDQTITINLKY